MPTADAPGEDPRFGPVTVLQGPKRGRYPEGNTLLVEGTRERLLIDPSLGLLGRPGPLPVVDRILNSHCHEDHIAGNHLFPDVPWHLHTLDAPGIRSLEGLLAIYGFPPAIAQPFRRTLVDDFHFVPRADPQTFADGHRFELGDVSVSVRHAPGHTRGHCCFEVEWTDDGRDRRLLYLADIDLTSFGPYYGDAWSDLADFERSLAWVRDVEADWYATFHHLGVLEGREVFLARLDRFEAKIAERESRLLEFLAEPREMAEIVRHRFVYRPGDAVSFADAVEERSMRQHLVRLIDAGVVRVDPRGRFRRA